MAELITATELNRLAQEIERRKHQKWLKEEEVHAAQQKELHDAFFEREISPNAKERISGAVRRAVEGGVHEVTVVTFPCSWTNDSGRRINNFETDWPESLDGFAKRAYDYYLKELQPAGYKVKAKVIGYTQDGIPKDIGLFLSW
jgi:hypothetical protein